MRRKTLTSLYPLRKIVGTTGDRAQFDVLECGHQRYRASDMFGERDPAKRRCPECWRALSQAERDRLIKEQAERQYRRADQAKKAWLRYSSR